MNLLLECQSWTENVGETGTCLWMDRLGSGLETVTSDPAPMVNLSSNKAFYSNQNNHPVYPHPRSNHGECGVGLDSVAMGYSWRKMFFTIAVCGDRHSVWIVVVPLLDKGLTAKEVALKMIDHFSPFEITTIIKTDQGSHFTVAWWTPLCVNLGIRQVSLPSMQLCLQP